MYVYEGDTMYVNEGDTMYVNEVTPSRYPLFLNG